MGKQGEVFLYTPCFFVDMTLYGLYDIVYIRRKSLAATGVSEQYFLINSESQLSIYKSFKAVSQTRY